MVICGGPNTPSFYFVHKVWVLCEVGGPYLGPHRIKMAAAGGHKAYVLKKGRNIIVSYTYDTICDRHSDTNR